MIPLNGNRPDRADYTTLRHESQKAEANQRILNQTTGGEVVILCQNYFVKVGYLLVQLCTDTAHQKVIVLWHLTKNEHWTILLLTIGLWHYSENQITLLHNLDSVP